MQVASRARQPGLLCSGGVLRQVPGQAGVQCLHEVQTPPPQMGEPISSLLCLTMGWFWCSWRCHTAPRAVEGVGCCSGGSCRCFANSKSVSNYQTLDWKEIDFIPGYCWLLGDPEPRQRFTRLVVGKTRLCSRADACWRWRLAKLAPACLQIDVVAMCACQCVLSYWILLCCAADRQPGTPWGSGIVLSK